MKIQLAAKTQDLVAPTTADPTKISNVAVAAVEIRARVEVDRIGKGDC